MAYVCCFSSGVNLDFPDFLQKKFYNINYWIVGKGGLWLTSFIYEYKTSTTYPRYETTRHFILINK